MHFSDEYLLVNFKPTKAGMNLTNRKARREEQAIIKARLAEQGLKKEYRFPLSQREQAEAKLAQIKKAVEGLDLLYERPGLGTAFSLSL